VGWTNHQIIPKILFQNKNSHKKKSSNYSKQIKFPQKNNQLITKIKFPTKLPNHFKNQNLTRKTTKH
jgi:hypothetical protein